jgi:hypothetical protein
MCTHTCVASTTCYTRRDHDLEGMTDGFDAGTAYGQIDGYEDVSMGWSRSVMGGPVSANAFGPRGGGVLGE